MKITYILTRGEDETLREIMERHKSAHDVTVVDIGEEKDYEKIVDVIMSSDKVISW